VARLPDAWVSTLSLVRISPAGTPQAWAAADTSIARAVAPAVRYCRYELAMADEPPVPCMPKARLAYSFTLAPAYSVRTSDQSASSSSATSVASPVVLPWPISWCLLTMVTRLSAPMLTNWLGSKTAWAAAPSRPCAAARAESGSHPMATTKPPAARMSRRVTPLRAGAGARVGAARARFSGASRQAFIIGCMAVSSSGELRRRGVDRGADADVGGAAADVAGHRLVDVGRRWASAFCSSSAVADMIWPDWQ
jgi:hypothetical protein